MFVQDKNVRTFDEWSRNSDWIEIAEMNCGGLKKESRRCLSYAKNVLLRKMSSRYFFNLHVNDDSCGELKVVRIQLRT